jgi:autotransporter-associated beta strand protein
LPKTKTKQETKVMKQKTGFRIGDSLFTVHRSLFTLLTLFLLAAPVHAGDGTWVNTAGGSWATAGNWSGNNIADGADSTADFSTLNITADSTVTLDGARTIGNLKFGDTTPSHKWILSTGGPLTLDVTSGTSTIRVNNSTANITLVLAGNDGVTVVGPGTLDLDTSTCTFTGGLTINGALVDHYLSNADNQINTNNALTLNRGSIFAYSVNNNRKQTFSGLTLSGANNCTAYCYQGNGNQTFDLALGGITRNSVGTIAFSQWYGGASTSLGYVLTTASNTGEGILGPWAFFYQGLGGSGATPDRAYRYAYNSGVNGVLVTSQKQIRGLAGTDRVNANSFASGENDNFNAGTTLTGSKTAHTARYTGTSASTTIIDNTFTLTLNGLLNAGTSSGGTLSSGALTINANGNGALVIGDTSELVVCAPANAITIAAPIQNNGATASVLTKAGVSNLTLSAVNTYTGDTWVHEGTLALNTSAGLRFKIGGNGTNNCVRGNGTLTLDGDFYFDLTGAGTTVGDSWMIVDVANLTETFTANFTVNGFTDAGDTFKWTKQYGTAFYEFNEATGVLTVTGTADAPVVIANSAVSGVTTAGATFNGLLEFVGTPAASAVYVLWGENTNAWANTNWWTEGGWTDNTPFSTNITTGIAADKIYYYTFGATNSATNVVAASPKSFFTGLVTVQATTNTAQYSPRTNGQYTIYRPAGSADSALTVYYSMSGTATNGVHYNLSLSAQFGAGETSTTITLAPKHLGVGTAILTLSGGYNYPTGAQNSATVTILTGYISPYVYVVQSGSSPAEPYDTWATAANSIQTAVNFAGAHLANGVNTVVISNGTYNITAEIAISQAMTVQSFGNGVYGGLANASNTVVQRTSGSTARIFNLTANATIDGFWMLKGGFTNVGQNVYMNNGLVCNSIIERGNLESGDGLDSWGYSGGGVYMDGGTVSNCVIRNNNAKRAAGGGVYANAGQIVNCQITDNTARYNSNNGGGVYAANGVVIRNCLIARNDANGIAGGVYRGTVQNCAIVANTAGSTAGGFYGDSGSTVSNSIVYGNFVGGASNNWSGGSMAYSCTTPTNGLAGAGNIQTDPSFVNAGVGDYRLINSSPCIDKGSNQAWMDGALDLAGNARKTYGGFGGYRASPVVDMGAYEAPETPPKGTVIMMR